MAPWTQTTNKAYLALVKIVIFLSLLDGGLSSGLWTFTFWVGGASEGLQFPVPFDESTPHTQSCIGPSP